jgi:hypothetical protein
MAFRNVSYRRFAMKDVFSKLCDVRRPELLIRAARIGAQGYRRNTHLTRLIGTVPPLPSSAALVLLMDLEAAINSCRTEERAGYSPARHVDILIAMMGEARALQQERSF